MSRLRIDEYARVNGAAWERHARQRLATETHSPGNPPDRLRWTQLQGLGPSLELLGDLAGRRVVELGCGPGDNLACVHERGASAAVGVDISVGQIARARLRWGRLPRISFVVDDARAFLVDNDATFDVCLSVFGAIGLCPPGQLLPLIAARLRVGGVLAFSVRHPTAVHSQRLLLADDCQMPIVSYHPCSTSDWITLAVASGLQVSATRELRFPGRVVPSCLIVQAVRSGAGSRGEVGSRGS
ncbi:MAG: class I SAM-dependent methyltransferase [Nocardioidaceae bacterium]